MIRLQTGSKIPVYQPFVFETGGHFFERTFSLTQPRIEIFIEIWCADRFLPSQMSAITRPSTGSSSVMP